MSNLPVGVDKPAYEFAERIMRRYQTECPYNDDVRMLEWIVAHAQDLSVRIQKAIDDYLDENV